jgi:hypothetical protein
MLLWLRRETEMREKSINVVQGLAIGVMSVSTPPRDRV